MSYDFFAERDGAETLRFPQDYQLAVYSLGGRMNQTLRNKLDQEEIKNLSLNNSKFSINYNRCGKV